MLINITDLVTCWHAGTQMTYRGRQPAHHEERIAKAFAAHLQPAQRKSTAQIISYNSGCSTALWSAGPFLEALFLNGGLAIFAFDMRAMAMELHQIIQSHVTCM
jgi:hypothetical protein